MSRRENPSLERLEDRVVLSAVDFDFSAQLVANPSAGAAAIAVIDANGDSSLDLVVGDTNDGTQIVTFLGNGTGGFTSAGAAPAGSLQSGFEIAVADFNRDGKQDFVTAQPGQIFLGNGDGTFNRRTTDIATSNYGAAANQGSVSVLLNTGGGSFTTNTVGFGFGFGSFNVRFDIVARDFDGDGDRDLMTTAADTQERFLFFANNGAGAFSAAEVIDVSHPTPNGLEFNVVAGDFNGDGMSDLVSSSGGTAVMYLGVVPNAPPIIASDSAAVSADEGGTVSNSGTFSDAQGNNTVTITASVGVVTKNDAAGTRSWSLNAADGPVGPTTVTITATDNQNATATTTFTDSVNNVTPTATLSNGGAVNEGSAGSVSFSNQNDPSSVDTAAGFRYAFDFDNNGTFEIGDGTYAGSGAATSATVPASFLADGNGARTVRGRILDKDGGFTDYTTAITVNNVAPTFEAGADETIQPPQLGAFSRSGIGITDPGTPETFSDTVDFGDGTGPQALTINQATREFDLSHTFPNTTSAPAIATYHVVITVNDGDGGSHTDAFDVTVNLNTPPVAVDDTPSTDEDHSVTINVLANDTDNQNNIDPRQTINLTSPSAGTLTNNGDGTFTFDPGSAFQHLAVGESATVTFDYRVFDAFGESDDGTVNITITGVNDGPSVSVNNASVTVNEAQTASNSGTWSEIDASDIVTITASVGTVTKNADGTWSWSFNTNDGPDQSQTVTITANDGNGGVAATTSMAIKGTT